MLRVSSQEPILTQNEHSRQRALTHRSFTCNRESNLGEGSTSSRTLFLRSEVTPAIAHRCAITERADFPHTGCRMKAILVVWKPARVDTLTRPPAEIVIMTKGTQAPEPYLAVRVFFDAFYQVFVNGRQTNYTRGG